MKLKGSIDTGISSQDTFTYVAILTKLGFFEVINVVTSQEECDIANHCGWPVKLSLRSLRVLSVPASPLPGNSEFLPKTCFLGPIDSKLALV